MPKFQNGKTNCKKGMQPNAYIHPSSLEELEPLQTI